MTANVPNPQFNPPNYAPRTQSTRPPSRPVSPLKMIMDILGPYTFLGVGACIQLVASGVGLWYVPPVLLILGPTARNVLVYCGLIENTYLKHVAFGRTSGKSPNVDEQGDYTGEMGVIQIGFRSNSPLGLLHPTARLVSRNFMEMIEYLTTNPEEAGYLNHENYMSNARDSGNTMMVFFYFRTWQDIHRFAHGMHMKGWREFARLPQSEISEIEIWHESYMISKSESIYVNTEPAGMGNIWYKESMQAAGKFDTQSGWNNNLSTITRKSSSKERIGMEV